MRSPSKASRARLGMVAFVALIVLAGAGPGIAEWALKLFNRGYAYASAAIFFGLLMTPIIGYGAYLASRRERKSPALNRCRTCGYALIPRAADRCPGCGRLIDPHSLRD